MWVDWLNKVSAAIISHFRHEYGHHTTALVWKTYGAIIAWAKRKNDAIVLKYFCKCIDKLRCVGDDCFSFNAFLFDVCYQCIIIP